MITLLLYFRIFCLVIWIEWSPLFVSVCAVCVHGGQGVLCNPRSALSMFPQCQQSSSTCALNFNRGKPEESSPKFQLAIGLYRSGTLLPKPPGEHTLPSKRQGQGGKLIKSVRGNGPPPRPRKPHRYSGVSYDNTYVVEESCWSFELSDLVSVSLGYSRNSFDLDTCRYTKMLR